MPKNQFATGAGGCCRDTPSIAGPLSNPPFAVKSGAVVYRLHVDLIYWRALSDANLAESHREFARWHPDGEILERRGLLLTRGAARYPGVNFALRTGSDNDPTQVVRRATEFFRSRADGFAIRAREHADRDLIEHCRENALFMAGENVGLIRVEPMTPDERASGELRPVESAEQAGAFATVATQAFSTIGLPEDTATRIFQQPQAMLAPHLIPVLAYTDGRPASAALGLMSHGVTGLYWVGTVPWARGRGLAVQVIKHVHNLALEMGSRAVVLQANARHALFYERLGYTPLARYPWFFAGNFESR